MTRRPPASMTRVFLTRRAITSASPPTATIFSPRAPKACASDWPCSVVTLALCTIKSGDAPDTGDCARLDRGDPAIAINAMPPPAANRLRLDIFMASS